MAFFSSEKKKKTNRNTQSQLEKATYDKFRICKLEVQKGTSYEVLLSDGKAACCQSYLCAITEMFAR